MKDLEERAIRSISELLDQIPAISHVRLEERPEDLAVDFLMQLDLEGQDHWIAVEVLSAAQPRDVRREAWRLRNEAASNGPTTTPVVVAPYLSPESRDVCREEGIGYLDLEGNARIVFEGVFIERQVASRPAAERRALKSLFKPKAARILRLLLRDPERAWRVQELADAAQVSLGQVSNVRKGLVEREWAEASHQGLVLSRPGVLLDAWRADWEPPGKVFRFYTTLHGSAFQEAVRPLLAVESEDGRAVLSSFSAARWQAPFGRTGMEYLHADADGLERLQRGLRLTTTSRGENVAVTMPKDPGLFLDAVEPAPGFFCTSPVTTYLELAAAGERGREAAEHLREECMPWAR
ncbi:hypothetical protein [Tistlia consotensis]|uniref:hypothetical protein n=1 Tax=Tistlia consotensis TaxID=1321365 RepID=UPI00190EED9D|nr:hypothetical protein [Tistlia consotensis]